MANEPNENTGGALPILSVFFVYKSASDDITKSYAYHNDYSLYF